MGRLFPAHRPNSPDVNQKLIKGNRKRANERFETRQSEWAVLVRLWRAISIPQASPLIRFRPRFQHDNPTSSIILAVKGGIFLLWKLSSRTCPDGPANRKVYNRPTHDGEIPERGRVARTSRRAHNPETGRSNRPPATSLLFPHSQLPYTFSRIPLSRP